MKAQTTTSKPLPLRVKVFEETIKQIEEMVKATNSHQSWVIAMAIQKMYDELSGSGLADFIAEVLSGSCPEQTYTFELDDRGEVFGIEQLKAA